MFPETNQSKAIVKGSLGAIAQEKGKSIAEIFLGVDAIILVDVSGSMTQNDAREQRRYDVACRELEKLQGQLPGKLAVVAFSGGVKFCPSGKPDFMMGMTDMEAALKFIKPADGCGIRLILISDGEPDEPEKTLKLAKKFQTKIDTVYVGSEDGDGRDFLRQLSDVTGGVSITQETENLHLLGDSVRKLLSA
jgi:Mg-chelatase subunit ChlD